MFTFSSFNMSCAEMTSKVGVAHKISRALTRAVYLAPPAVNPGSAPGGRALYKDASRAAYILGPPPSRGGGFELEGGINVSL